MQGIFYVVAGLLIMQGLTGVLGWLPFFFGAYSDMPQPSVGKWIAAVLRTSIGLGLGIYLWALAGRLSALYGPAIRQRSLRLGSLIVLALGLYLAVLTVLAVLPYYTGESCSMALMGFILVPPAVALLTIGVAGLLKAQQAGQDDEHMPG